jgi:hypothetical protein
MSAITPWRCPECRCEVSSAVKERNPSGEGWQNSDQRRCHSCKLVSPATQPGTKPAPVTAKRGDLILTPGTISAVASHQAAAEGIAQSYSKTVWAFGVVTSVSRAGLAIGHQPYHLSGAGAVYPSLPFKGAVVGGRIAPADKLKPLSATDVAQHFAGQDWPTPEEAAAALKALLDEARAKAKAAPQRVVWPDGRMTTVAQPG